MVLCCGKHGEKEQETDFITRRSTRCWRMKINEGGGSGILGDVKPQTVQCLNQRSSVLHVAEYVWWLVQAGGCWDEGGENKAAD